MTKRTCHQLYEDSESYKEFIHASIAKKLFLYAERPKESIWLLKSLVAIIYKGDEVIFQYDGTSF